MLLQSISECKKFRKCKKRKKFFTSIAKLKIHARFVHGKLSKGCKLCKKVFRGQRKVHTKIFHTKGKLQDKVNLVKYSKLLRKKQFDQEVDAQKFGSSLETNEIGAKEVKDTAEKRNGDTQHQEYECDVGNSEANSREDLYVHEEQSHQVCDESSEVENLDCFRGLHCDDCSYEAHDADADNLTVHKGFEHEALVKSNFLTWSQ